MKSNRKRTLCLSLILCLLLPVTVACAKKEEVYLNSFTRVYDGSNTLLELQSYTYNEYGQILTYTSDSLRRTCTYDKDGNLLTDRTEYLKDGTVTETLEERMAYDRRGNEITHSRYAIEGGSETLLGTVEKEYDGEDRLVRETGSQTVTVYTYTANDGYTSTESLIEGGDEVCVITVVKDENGQVTSRRTERKDTGSTESYTATYNEAGELLTETYAMNGAELESYRYEYDTHGDHAHLARVITLRGETEIERMVYGYDKHHNRTEGALCAPDGRVKRSYIYEYTATEVKLLKD